jgi:protoporphyrin/coproporphyrin ferrochelatase
MEIGVLLINVGTPASPEPVDVKHYLKEFLMDPLVIDIPWLFRWFLVNKIILKSRPEESSKLYKKIWTQSGSPILSTTRKLCEKVAHELGSNYHVEIGMRYGSPSISEALKKFQSYKEILVVPLYPQFSLAATQSAIEEVNRVTKNMAFKGHIKALGAFYNSQKFINAFCEVSKPVLSEVKPDHIIFSFHGLPERHVKKTDDTKSHCLSQASCCDIISEVNKNCYRAQSYATARAIAMNLQIPTDQYSVGFQSRLNNKWIRPFTDELYDSLAARGVKTLAVISPSFVTDCLETLEEIAIRGSEQFQKAGGQKLTLVPSLNAHPAWIKTLSELIRDL